jgi:hypothetical protein
VSWQNLVFINFVAISERWWRPSGNTYRHEWGRVEHKNYFAVDSDPTTG